MKIKSLVILCAFSVLTACGSQFSDGDRVGLVSKLSNKGLVFKSWEGEMILGGTSDGVANVWRFHVNDTNVVRQIQESMGSGSRVKLHYNQWALAPLSQESDYDVTSVTVVP